MTGRAALGASVVFLGGAGTTRRGPRADRFSASKIIARRRRRPCVERGCSSTDQAKSLWQQRRRASSMCCRSRRDPRGLPAGHALAPRAALRYPRQHLAAGHRLWRTRAQHGQLFLQGIGRRRPHGDHTGTVVLYCQANCWMSWNAAKRAQSSAIRMSPVSRRNRWLERRRPAPARCHAGAASETNRAFRAKRISFYFPPRRVSVQDVLDRTSHRTTASR